MSACDPGDIARVCHAAIRVLQDQAGDPVSPPWNEVTEEARRSAVSGVEFALRGGTPEEQHAEWSRCRLAEGWAYGPVKDAEAKTHPALIPYVPLPESQRVKDRVVIAIAMAMAGPAPCGRELELGGVAYACERAPHLVDGYGPAFRHAAAIDARLARGTDEGDGPADLVTWGEDGSGDGQDWAVAWGTAEAYGTSGGPS